MAELLSFCQDDDDLVVNFTGTSGRAAVGDRYLNVCASGVSTFHTADGAALAISEMANLVPVTGAFSPMGFGTTDLALTTTRESTRSLRGIGGREFELPK